MLASFAIGVAVAHPAINYVATVPGDKGTMVAFIAEAVISFGLMLTVLTVSNYRALSSLTGLFAGILVAIYIAIEAPLSGMSMNPARTLASALQAHLWTAFWVYITAPLIGMLAAAELYGCVNGCRQVYCAKLHHQNTTRCIFQCKYPDLED